MEDAPTAPLPAPREDPPEVLITRRHIPPELEARATRAIQRFAAGEVDVGDVIARFREANVFKDARRLSEVPSAKVGRQPES